MSNNLRAKILISDLILIWRASVVCPDQRWIIIGPLSLLWLATVGKSWMSVRKLIRFAEIVISRDERHQSYMDIDSSRLRLLLHGRQ